jgi:hypothetical protein
MSAIADGDKPEIVKTIFILHPGFDLVSCSKLKKAKSGTNPSG